MVLEATFATPTHHGIVHRVPAKVATGRREISQQQFVLAIFFGSFNGGTGERHQGNSGN